jgi:virginiamycin B lyase
VCGERARRRLADPAAGARDERDRVLEFVAHGPEGTATRTLAVEQAA